MEKNLIGYYLILFARKIAKLTYINRLCKKVYFDLFKPKDSKIIHLIQGISACFYVKNYTQLIYLTKTVVGLGDERKVIELILENIEQGDVVYDIGSFLGFHTVFFAKKSGENGKVIAFEPSVFSYRCLLDNIKLNNLNNVIVFNTALGDESKRTILRGNDPSAYSLSQEYEKSPFSQEIEVMIGDALFETGIIIGANVVKIDVEGYEYSVVKGLEKILKNASCRLLCCEVHPTLLPKGVTPEMIINHIKSLGFQKVKTYGRGDVFHIFCYK